MAMACKRRCLAGMLLSIRHHASTKVSQAWLTVLSPPYGRSGELDFGRWYKTAGELRCEVNGKHLEALI